LSTPEAVVAVLATLDTKRAVARLVHDALTRAGGQRAAAEAIAFHGDPVKEPPA